VVAENMVMLVHNYNVRVLPGLTNAFKDALRILPIRGVPWRARQIGCRLVLPVAGVHPKLIHAGAIRSGASARCNQA